MGTKKGVGIGIVAGVAISIIAVYALFATSGFSTKIAASDETATTETDSPKTTTTITRTSDGQKPSSRVSGMFDSDPGELVTIYENCKTSMLTDPGRPNQTAKAKCYASSNFSPDKTFIFKAPAQFVDSGTMCFTCQSRVYVYENSYELAFSDQVGEKRYPVTLRELPK